jgi:hypothetical protein
MASTILLLCILINLKLFTIFLKIPTP